MHSRRLAQRLRSAVAQIVMEGPRVRARPQERGAHCVIHVAGCEEAREDLAIGCGEGAVVVRRCLLLARRGVAVRGLTSRARLANDARELLHTGGRTPEGESGAERKERRAQAGA